MDIDTVQWKTTSENTLKASQGRYDSQSLKKLFNILESKRIVFLAVPAFVYLDWAPMICHVMGNRFKSVAYISLVWSSQVVLRNFEQFKEKTGLCVHCDDFFIIDAADSKDKGSEHDGGGIISGIFGKKKASSVKMGWDADSMAFASSISKKIAQEGSEAVFVDTITSVKEYYRDSTQALRFAHSLIHDLRDQNRTAVFPFPIDKSSVSLGRDLQMFADATAILK